MNVQKQCKKEDLFNPIGRVSTQALHVMKESLADVAHTRTARIYTQSAQCHIPRSWFWKFPHQYFICNQLTVCGVAHIKLLKYYRYFIAIYTDLHVNVFMLWYSSVYLSERSVSCEKLLHSTHLNLNAKCHINNWIVDIFYEVVHRVANKLCW